MENIEQGSESWHAWRDKGIGASEAPAIMGESPYETFLQWWERRTKRRPPIEQNFAMARGSAMEPKARATFELTTDIEMKPILGEHKDYPFIKASLDGYNEEHNIALEIKCCGKKKLEEIKSGVVPMDYRAQIQQQILVSGVEKVILWGFDGDVGVRLDVPPDIEYCKKLLAQLIKAWEHVQTDTPPEPDPKRDFEIINDPALEEYSARWKYVKSSYDMAKKELDELEDKIRTGLQINRGICNGLRFTKSFRKGSVDYQAIPELKGLDLDKFRKPGTETFSIRPIKKKE